MLSYRYFYIGFYSDPYTHINSSLTILTYLLGILYFIKRELKYISKDLSYIGLNYICNFTFMYNNIFKKSNF